MGEVGGVLGVSRGYMFWIAFGRAFSKYLSNDEEIENKKKGLYMFNWVLKENRIEERRYFKRNSWDVFRIDKRYKFRKL